MSVHRLISFIILIISTHYVHSDERNIEIEFIKDYLQVYAPERYNVFAFLCWNKAEKYTLLKQLNSNNIRVAILNENSDSNTVECFPAQNILYYVDIDCSKSIHFLKAANNQNMFAGPYKWVFLSKNEQVLEKVDEHFSQFNILPDSDVILVHRTDVNQFTLTEIYKIHKNQEELHRREITTWIREQGFAIVKLRILARSRQNLNGTLLRSSIVITNNDSVNHLHDYRHKHIDTITKVNYVFTNHLIDMVNGTREFFYVNSWGYKYKNNNSYTGMIGTLQRHEAEIGGTALFMTVDRVPIIEYASMTTPTRAKFVFRQPPLSYVANVFTLPFSRAVWISSFLLVGFASTLLYSTVFWEWHQPNLEESSNAMANSFSDAVMLTIAAVAQQGSTSEPRSAAGKIVMIFTFIALMFLYVSYSANIVALLQSSATNIRSLEDLLKSRLKLGVDDTVYNHYYFETATEPVRKAIYEQKVAPLGQKPRYMTMESGVSKMRQGFFAFHMELGAGYKLVGDTFLESEKCGLQEIAYLQVVDPYLAIKKNSSYKEMLKIGLRKIQESGIQSRELQKLYTKKPECHTGGGNFVSVGLIDAYPAFLVLIAGLGISVIMFLSERLIYKRVICCRTKRILSTNIN